MLITLLSIGLLICIALSAFFSASEMAYSSCNLVRLENLKEDGHKNAARALKIVEDYENALGSILVGNNLVNIAASTLGSVLVIELLKSDSYAWLSTLVVTLLVIIFGETIPKISAKANATNLAIRFAIPITVLEFILKPFVKITVKSIALITKNIKDESETDEDSIIDEKIDELSSIIEIAEDENVLDEDQSELVQAAIDFLDVSAIEVMTSRVDLVAIDIEDDKEAQEDIIFNSGYSRIPVYKESIDNIVGILHASHYLKERTNSKEIVLENLLLKPCYVYKAAKLTTVLDKMRDYGQHLAIVCDEYGGTIGVITIEDIMEEIVGEIWDETDEIEQEIKEISNKEFEVDGDISISDLCELLSIDEDNFETVSETAGGWALEHFEDYPNNGDLFEQYGYVITVLNIEDRRIDKLKIIKNN